MMTVGKLAELIGAKVLGDATIQLTAPAKIESAKPGEITFLSHSRYKEFLSQCQASAIISTAQLADSSLPYTWLLVQDPMAAFALTVAAFFPPSPPQFATAQAIIDSSAIIHPSAIIGSGACVGAKAEIGENVVIYPTSYIGEQVKVGANSIIYPGAKVMDGCLIGENCILHPGAVIGADGFGFTPLPDGSYRKVPQKGIVILEDYVDIGANTCIDRATLGATIIKQGTKIDNLVQVGHNVQIGEHSVIASQVGFAGSSTIGHHARVGGQAGFAPHIEVAPFVSVNAQSGVSKSVEKTKSMLTGSPAEPYMEFYRKQALLKKLNTLTNQINECLHLLRQSSEKDD